MNVETHNRYFRDIAFNQEASVSWPLHFKIQPISDQAVAGAEEKRVKEASFGVPFLPAIAPVYDARIEGLLRDCVHIKSVIEIVVEKSPGMCVCVYVSVRCVRL